MGYPVVRPRRLRRTPALRRLVARDPAAPAELVLPLFVEEGLTEPRADRARCPGSSSTAGTRCARRPPRLSQAGIGGLMLFGVPRPRTRPAPAARPDGILNVAIRDVKAEVGDATVVMSDLCLDEFTSHGHCGVLAADGSVDNDATLACYAEMAVAQAAAGVDWSAPPG